MEGEGKYVLRKKRKKSETYYSPKKFIRKTF
jgi:hypothetical protein